MKLTLVLLAGVVVAAAANDPRTMGMGLLTISIGIGTEEMNDFALRDNPAAVVETREMPALKLTEYGYYGDTRFLLGVENRVRRTLVGVGYPIPPFLWRDEELDVNGLAEYAFWTHAPSGLEGRFKFGRGVLEVDAAWPRWREQTSQWIGPLGDSHTTNVVLDMPHAGLAWATQFGPVKAGAGGFMAYWRSATGNPSPYYTHEETWFPGGKLGALMGGDRLMAGAFGSYYRVGRFDLVYPEWSDDVWRLGLNVVGRPTDWLRFGLCGGWNLLHPGMSFVPAQTSPWAELRAGFSPQGTPIAAGFHAVWANWGSARTDRDDSILTGVGVGWRRPGLFVGLDLTASWQTERTSYSRWVDAAQTIKLGVELGRTHLLRCGAFVRPRELTIRSDSTVAEHRSRQWGVTAGAGLPLGCVQVDIGYVGKWAAVDNSQGYEHWLHELALGVAYRPPCGQ
jgi:hypothetical protein